MSRCQLEIMITIDMHYTLDTTRYNTLHISTIPDYAVNTFKQT